MTKPVQLTRRAQLARLLGGLSLLLISGDLVHQRQLDQSVAARLADARQPGEPATLAAR